MSAELVGPLRRVRFADDTVRGYDLPRSTIDIRYAACAGHHTACDCREAMLAEVISEYRAESEDLQKHVLAAIKGHQTYAYTADGWPDRLAQCKCGACGIARAARIGFSQSRKERREADERLAAERRMRERHGYHIDLLGVTTDD